MNLYTKLVSSVLFPLHEALKKHDTVKIRRVLEDSQWLEEGVIYAQQLTSLRDFLCDIERQVPYYRRIFQEHDFVPGRLASLSDLERLPFLDKAAIRENTQQLKSVSAKGLTRFSTGGSSGEPLMFYLNNERVSHDVAAKWRATRWWGVDIGDPEIVFWGSPIELEAQDHLRIWRDRFLRSTLLSAFDLSAECLRGYLEVIRSKRPRMLFGYPSVIAQLAGYAREQGIAMDDCGVKVAFVTSEKLYDWQKSLVSEVFSCSVANGYGGRDAGFIAHECPQGGMHVTAEDIVIEIVDPAGNVLPAGVLGEVVVTHLRTKAFPFVRYRTGDMAILSKTACPCGRGLPLLEDVAGRSTDFIVTKEGKVLHGLALIYVLREIEEIKAFKIVQESVERLTIFVVPGLGYHQDIEGRIREEILRRLSSDVAIEIDQVTEIKPERSGKYRYVVSKVDVQKYRGGVL